MITRLVVVGENMQLDLPAEQERFTLGAASAPAVDLTLRGELVSRLHAVLDAQGRRSCACSIRSSTNGTFYNDRRDPDFELYAGQVFEVSRRVKLLALDPGLAVLRHRLLWVVGLRNRAAADERSRCIATNAPILLVGAARLRAARDRGRDPSPVGVQRSRVRDRPLDLRLPRRASAGAGARHPQHGLRRPDPRHRADAGHFVTHLFEDCRPIIAATSREQALEVFDKYADRLRAIDLATPAERPDDIPRLLDALVIEEHARAGGGDLLPIAALGASNVDALKAHPWPDHFADLRAQVKRLHAVLTNGLRLRASARALGLKSPTALVQALERIGVHLAAADGDDVPTSEDAEALPTPPGARTRP
jgi:hypothetical protein